MKLPLWTFSAPVPALAMLIFLEVHCVRPDIVAAPELPEFLPITTCPVFSILASSAATRAPVPVSPMVMSTVLKRAPALPVEDASPLKLMLWACAAPAIKSATSSAHGLRGRIGFFMWNSISML
ncbi:hypothetical protein [Comamonas piscis]